MDAAYTHLADWFEYLNADCDYEKWSQYLHKKLLGAGVAAGRGLDLGCGSGKFTRMLSRMGYGMTGIDASGEMLAAAARTAVRVKFFSFESMMNVLIPSEFTVFSLFRSAETIRFSNRYN